MEQPAKTATTRVSGKRDFNISHLCLKVFVQKAQKPPLGFLTLKPEKKFCRSKYSPYGDFFPSKRKVNYLRVNPKLFEITRLGDNKNLSRFVSEIVGKKAEMAEGVGFEPTNDCSLPVFKTGAFNRSAILPQELICSVRSCALHC